MQPPVSLWSMLCQFAHLPLSKTGLCLASHYQGSFGLGTQAGELCSWLGFEHGFLQVPWDEQFVIESLSCPWMHAHAHTPNYQDVRVYALLPFQDCVSLHVNIRTALRSDSTIYMAYYTVAHLLHGEVSTSAAVLRVLRVAL